MKANRVVFGVVCSLVVGLVALSGPAQGRAFERHSAAPTETGNAVTAWNEIAVGTLIRLPGPEGGAPPAAQIHVAMVQGAVYDAVNAIVAKHHQPYLLKRRFSSNASKDAAVATAAYAVLHDIVAHAPNTVAPPARAALLQSLATQYADAIAEIPSGPSKDKGIKAGTAAAQSMISARRDDGRFGDSQWIPSREAGHWWPLGDPPVLDPTPWVGTVKPFVMTSPSQFRTPGPNDLDSDAWAKDFNEVKALGRFDAPLSVRSATQTNIARWWQSTPVASWNDVARQLITRNGLGVAASARLLAMENLAGADASINTWNDKYYYDFWRPWNAITRADEDDNPATEADPTWTALITAPYPDHPSGHLGLDASHTRILHMFFGDVIDGGYTITSLSTLPLDADFPRTREFNSFSQALDEVLEARIWAGLHYRTADVQAEELGNNVADYLVANYFRPVGNAG